MNIIYVSSCCSNGKFEQLRVSGETKTIPQAQKYHQLLVEGLSKQINGEVFAVSAVPTNHKWSKKVKYVKEIESFENITYIYESFINYPVLRQLTLCSNAKKTIKKLCGKDRNTIIICDVLNYSVSKAALQVAKKLRIKTIGIVTDIPGLQQSDLKNASFIKKLILKYASNKKLKQIEKFDSYLLLAEAMNEVINKNKKPYVVIEGQADINMAKSVNDLALKQTPKVVMYAGSLHKEYGIKLLVEAFTLCNFEGYELHVYGKGNYVNELQNICSTNNSIKYFGVVSNEEVVKKQLTATLLVNPRPTNEDFVKYSFPSKTMEYMASGTPLLTTKIPSMPSEYFNYVYFIEDETVEGVKTALQTVLNKTDNELYEKGVLAKRFILEEKNNYLQAKKLIDFIDNDFNSL